MGTLDTAALQQLDAVLAAYRGTRTRSQYDDVSDQGRAETGRLLTLARSAVERIAGRSSAYHRQIEETLKQHGADNAYNIPQLMGVVAALRDDAAAGHLASIAALLHAEVFGDFLEMASHLLDGGYKDAAAVIAGSALEGHLRQLCAANEIATEVTSGADVHQKKADRLNADLAGAGAITKLDQKSVTAWLDLRNNAAHGHYTKYDNNQVSLMIAGIRDFVVRTPA